MQHELTELLDLLLTKENTETVYNQYTTPWRLTNLEIYLKYVLERNTKLLLVGEAPGYKGCRSTGIPFTSFGVIQNSRHEMFRAIRDRLIIGENFKEITATIMWEFLGENRMVPIMWDVYPFHPFVRGIPEKNRGLTSEEREEGVPFLRLIIDIFKPNQIVAVGNIAEESLKNWIPEFKGYKIRHPSRGGKQGFTDGMLKIYSNEAIIRTE